MMAADWAQLPLDLLLVISAKLTMNTDYLRFRAVCKTWRSSAPRHLPCVLPWLMLPTSNPHPDQPRRAFLSLSELRYHVFSVPDAASPQKRRRGSSCGWVAILDETPNLYLLNPLTGARIPLPPLSSFPSVVGFDFADVGREYTLALPNGDEYKIDLKRMRDLFLKKFVISGSPGNGGDFVVAALLNETADIAFCRRDDHSWSSIEGTEPYSEDAVYHEGLLYAVRKNGRVAVCDVSSGSSSPKATIIETTPLIFGGDLQYLVSSGDDLLLVIRYLEVDYDYDREITFKTRHFEVFRLDPMEAQWDEVKSLGDSALFLGENSSVSVVITDVPNCKGNCIYYTDDHSELGFNYNRQFVDFDVGVFNLEDNKLEPVCWYQRDPHHDVKTPSPLWVMPNPW